MGTPTPLSLANALATEVVWPQVFHMTLRKADGAELGLNVKPLDGPKAKISLDFKRILRYFKWFMRILGGF